MRILLPSAGHPDARSYSWQIIVTPSNRSVDSQRDHGETCSSGHIHKADIARHLQEAAYKFDKRGTVYGLAISDLRNLRVSNSIAVCYLTNLAHSADHRPFLLTNAIPGKKYFGRRIKESSATLK